MAEPGIFQAADDFRAALLRHERAASSELVRQYGAVYRSIQDDLDRLAGKMEDTLNAGKPMTPAWLFQEGRLQALQQQVAAEIGRYAYGAGLTIQDMQRLGVDLAGEDARRLVMAGMGRGPDGVALSWARLPDSAFTDLVGFTQDGSPLADLLAQLGADGAERVKAGLLQGIGMGLSPREVARFAGQALGGNLARSLTIARTEMLRAYRESSRRTYQANSDLVTGWVWHSALGTRTCAACWAMHGTRHSLDERLDGHPNCRCAMVPYTKTWKELGYDVPETRADVPAGPDLFAGLSPAEQRAILGPAKYDAFARGDLRLTDLVGRRNDPRWGTMRYERSLRDALGNRATVAGQPAATVPQVLRSGPKLRKALADLEPALQGLRGEIAALEREIKLLQGPSSGWPESFAKLPPWQQRDVRHDFYASITDRKNKIAQMVFDVLRVDNPGTMAAQFKRADDVMKLRLANGLRTFNDLVGVDSVNGVKVSVSLRKGARAFALGMDQVTLSPADGTATMVHEFGHILENNSPAIRQAARDFLDARTAGESAQSLRTLTGNSAYGPTEVAKPDKFWHPYVGKIYQHGSTEIISMGIERLSYDAVAFAQDDPEYFDFIVHTLRGEPWR